MQVKHELRNSSQVFQAFEADGWRGLQLDSFDTLTGQSPFSGVRLILIMEVVTVVSFSNRVFLLFFVF